MPPKPRHMGAAKPRPRPPKPALPASSRDRRIVVIPIEPVRVEWLQKLEAARVEEERWKQRVAEFEATSQPFFEAWMTRHFASQRADMNRLLEEVRGLEILEGEVIGLSQLRGLPRWQSYAILQGFLPDPDGIVDDMRRIVAGEDEEEDDDGEEAVDDFADEFGEDGPPPEFVELMRESMIAMLRAQGLSKREAEQVWQMHQKEEAFRREAKKSDPRESAPPPRPTSRPAAPKPRAQECRRLFRLLARRLHPDAGAGPMDARKLGLWHEVQSAWEREDLEALEALVWETETDAAAQGSAPVGVVTRVLQTVKFRVKELQRRWEKLRGTPAGQVAGATEKEREKIRRGLARDLQADLFHLESVRDEMRARQNEWAFEWERFEAKRKRAAAAAAKPPKPKKKPTPTAVGSTPFRQAEFPF